VKILALEQPVPGSKPAAFTEALLREEATRAWDLYQAGVIREMHFRADRHEAVLTLECADILAARAALESLPLVRAGLIDFELVPLVPYPGFARLFAPARREG
jgi:muconolactone delta-isomerase